MQDLETSGSVRIQRLDPMFVDEHWEELIPYLRQLPQLPREYRSDADLNNLLANVLAGFSYIWVAFTEEGEIRACSILSRGISGPEGHDVMHLEGLMSFGTIPQEVFDEGMDSFVEHARRLGCVGMCAETTEKGVVKLAEKLGWKSYPMTKLYKEL